MKFALGIFVSFFSLTSSPIHSPRQVNQHESEKRSAIQVEYPDETGVLIHDREWTAIDVVAPVRARTKRGFVAAMTHGAITANLVVEYQGQRADLQLGINRPVICVCSVTRGPIIPLLVKLQIRKDARELDGGRLLAPGAAVADARHGDVIPTNISRPETGVLLLQPKEPLPVGEYAVLIGSQNMAIYPFGISPSPPTTEQSTRDKR